MNLLAFRNRTLVPPPRSPFRVRIPFLRPYPKDTYVFRNDLPALLQRSNGSIDEPIGVYSYQTHIKYLSLNQIARQPRNIPNSGTLDGGGTKSKTAF
ncbi:hypothetical protein TNCT_602831 [Trichonephila clavata]|uniref:Uncharacterized protein n=1 Tax=Trichonephila clavata TaxID=2740835 RepID=A0A8X6JBA6_TRICU|nr:hypothetical protein TNCT_602831 [Trichonephila clavata]